MILFSKKKSFLFFFIFTFLFSKDDLKIGLVLSGGGSKGFAHIAALKALDSLNIPIDYISGTSFGAIIGAMYALGYSGKQIEKMALATDWYEVQNDEPERKYLPYFRKKDSGKYQLKFGLDGFKPVAPTGLIYGQKIILDLSKWTREYEQIYNFDNLPIPFRCNAFDILTGKELILKEGSLSHALRASLSIPTIFAPVEWGDALLVDGGVVNNLPVDIVKDMGANIVLAIDVSATAKNKSELNNIYDIIDQTIGVHGYEKTKISIDQADFYIRPNIETISFTDYQISTIKYLFSKGEEAVVENWHVFTDLKKLVPNRNQKTKTLIPLKKPIVKEVIIKGNKVLNKNFIRSFIGIENDMSLNPKMLDENIAELYSLGYFKIIYYEIISIAKDQVNLVINVQEAQLRKFNLGLKWDNFYDLIGVANIQLNSQFIPGLKIENEVQFAGIQKNIFSIYYPSRKLNFPVYPFLRATNMRYPIKNYFINKNPESYLFTTSNFQTGIGILLKNYWSTESSYFIKKDNLVEENTNNKQSDTYTGIKLNAQLDLIDDVLFPWNGILIKSQYEKSDKEWRSTKNYDFYSFYGDFYITKNKNTFRFMSYYHNATNDIPHYKLISYGGSKSFVGLQEFQLWGKSLFFTRTEYRYKHKKDIFLHLIFNYLLNAKADNSISTKNIGSFGLGITLLSPLGPMEFIWSKGPKDIYQNQNLQNLFYFSAGYNF